MGITVNTAGLMSSSGFDVQGLADTMMEAAAAPEQAWKNQQTTLSGQTSALNQLSSDLSSVNSSVQSLTDVLGAFAQRTASSSDSGIVSATATTAATVGQHTVTVTSLATKAVYYSDTSVATGDTALSGGSMTVTVGSNIQTVSIGGSTNTLNTLAKKINGLNMGVTASVITDTSGAKLALVSNNTGKASDISLTTTADSALTFTKSSDGADAVASVDGIPVTSANNVISNVIPGLTLNLNGQLPGSPVTVSVEANADGVTQAVTDFVNAYNALTSDINAQFTYDSTSGSSGVLAGDSTVRTVQEELMQAVSGINVSNSGTPTLGSLGITMNDDGTLSLDSSTLNAALSSQFSDVQTFFQDPTQGFATQLGTLMTSLSDPVNGAFVVDLQGITNTQTGLTNDINNFEANLALQRQQLVTQLTQANDALEALPNQLNEINAELGSLSNSSSNNKSS